MSCLRCKLLAHGGYDAAGGRAGTPRFILIFIFQIVTQKKGNRKENITVKKHGQYILFRLLVSLRWIVQIICKIVTFVCMIGGVGLCVYNMWKEGVLLIVVGIVSYLLRIYYDRLIFKIKPDDTDLWVS